jgi:hypothetical protein
MKIYLNRSIHLKAFQLIIILVGLLDNVCAQRIDGLWKDAYHSPMTSYFNFDNATSKFKSYYYDDTRGSFGKGHFSIKSTNLYLTFDSIICDKPIVELLDNDKINDTTYIYFFQYWGFPKRLDILENNKILFSDWTTSSDSIIEEHILIKIPKILDSIECVIFDHDGSKDKEIKRFNIRLFEKPFCNLYYYPSNSWYEYEQPQNSQIKIKWKNRRFFEIPGKYKYGFKKIR